MKLIGWILTEGRIPGQHVSPDPSMSDVISAIEAIHVDMRNPYVILASPEIDGKFPDYCQTLAVVDSAYRCEIRLFGSSPHEYRHYSLMRPDELGKIGTPQVERPGWISGYAPDLATACEVFTRFVNRPGMLPEIAGWQWLDITRQVDAEI